VVNATRSRQRFELNVSGAKLGGRPTLWRMTGSSVRAADTLGHQPQVVVKKFVMRGIPRAVTVAPISIDIYRIPLVRER
jgi:hypothetical protein